MGKCNGEIIKMLLVCHIIPLILIALMFSCLAQSKHAKNVNECQDDSRGISAIMLQFLVKIGYTSPGQHAKYYLSHIKQSSSIF